MARRIRKADTGSLDSLLDTMTNVVGILVILLAVTQLGVGDAVKRILRSRTGGNGTALNVPPEELKVTEQEAEQLNELLVKLRAQWADIKAQRDLDSARLDEIRKLIDELKRELQQKPDSAVNADQIRKLINDREKESQQLEKKISQAEQERAKLMAQIEKTPVYKTPAPKVVTLPNPRPAPPGSEPLKFLCVKGRIMPVNIERLQRVVEVSLPRAVGEIGSDKEIDCEKLVEFFDTHTLGDENFRIRIRIHNFRPWMVLELRPAAGESTERLIEPDSNFQRTVRGVSKTSYYAQFLVWPDSFDTYIEARAITSDLGMEAGWEPRTGSDEYSTMLDGGYYCKGRPPQPPPPPETRPEQNHPAETRHVRPPPPVDTID